MSVINQMLRDLDERQASAQERAGLPPKLRTLPPSSRVRMQQWKVLALGMGLGALLAGGIVTFFIGTARAPVPAAPPAPAVPVVAPPVAPPAVAVAPAPSLPAAPEPAAASEVADMKLAIQLSTPPAEPQKIVAPKPAPMAPVPPPKSVPVPVPASAPKPSVAPPHPKEVPHAPPARVDEPPEARIDKRAQGGGNSQAHALADNEYRKGMQALKNGDATAALTTLQHALELDPAFAKARQALLAVLVGGRQWGQARQVAESGLALDATQSGWAVILARLQFEQGDAAAAVATLEKYAAHAKRDAEYQGLFGYLLQKQQRPAEAVEHFQAALAQRPGEGRWWFGLAVAFENSGKAAEAKEAYAKAREAGNLSADMATIVEQKLR